MIKGQFYIFYIILSYDFDEIKFYSTLYIRVKPRGILSDYVQVIVLFDKFKRTNVAQPICSFEFFTTEVNCIYIFISIEQ